MQHKQGAIAVTGPYSQVGIKGVVTVSLSRHKGV